MALQGFEQQIAQRLKDKLAEAMGEHVIQLKVFGSRARGQAGPISDMDVFVMVDSHDRSLRRKVSDIAYDVELEFEFPFLIQTVVMSRDHFARLLQLERRIARDIVEEGVLL